MQAFSLKRVDTPDGPAFDGATLASEIYKLCDWLEEFGADASLEHIGLPEGSSTLGLFRIIADRITYQVMDFRTEGHKE